MVLALRVVMFLGVLAGHAQSCRVISWISCHPSASVSGHTTQNTTSTRSLPAPRKQFQPAALPHASRRNTNHTSTDCDVHDHVVPDIQPECGPCLTRRIYFAFARQCKYEHGQKPNHQHHALEAAMSCDEGLKIKQHTSCVAHHIVRLRAFRKRPRPAVEHAATTVTYGSAIDRSRSAETQRHRSFLVRWRRRHSATQH